MLGDDQRKSHATTPAKNARADERTERDVDIAAGFPATIDARRHDDRTGEAWMHGRFDYVLCRHAVVADA
jgi:hypothetical protein